MPSYQTVETISLSAIQRMISMRPFITSLARCRASESLDTERWRERGSEGEGFTASPKGEEFDPISRRFGDPTVISPGSWNPRRLFSWYLDPISRFDHDSRNSPKISPIFRLRKSFLMVSFVEINSIFP